MKKLIVGLFCWLVLMLCGNTAALAVSHVDACVATAVTNTNLKVVRMYGTKDPNISYAVEISSNLTTWADIGYVGASGSTVMDKHVGVFDKNEYASAFFRLRENPTALLFSLSPETPQVQHIIASSGTNNNEADRVPVLKVVALAGKGPLTINDLTVSIKGTAAVAGRITTAYLYSGPDLIANAAFIGGRATFTQIDQAFAGYQSRLFTVMVDVRNAQSVFPTESFTIELETDDTVSKDALGNDLRTSNSVSGEAASNYIMVVAHGASTSVVSSTIDIVTSRDQNGVTTEAHLAAAFNVKINAIGADAGFSLPEYTFTFQLFRNGVDVTASAAEYATRHYSATQPSGTINYSTNGFTIPQNGEAIIPITFKVDTLDAATTAAVMPPGAYSVQLKSIAYMSGDMLVINTNSSSQAWFTPTAIRP